MSLRAREAAFFIIRHTLGPERMALDAAMQRLHADRRIAPDQRSFTMLLAFGVIRHLLWLDHVLAPFLRAGWKNTPPDFRNLLRLGAYQLIFTHVIPDFAAVSETVNLARRHVPLRAAGLINAVLRRCAEQSAQLHPDRFQPEQARSFLQYLSLRYSFPRWMVQLFVSLWGEREAEKFCIASNTEAPLTVRLNTVRVTKEQFLNQLEQLGLVRAEPAGFPEEAYHIRPAGQLENVPAFRDGWVYAQDAASQLVSHVVNSQPGEHICDFCAAPGGKTTHLASLSAGEATIHALDVDRKRCSLIQENVQRLGLTNVEIHATTESVLKRLQQIGMDRVLVDAPCSALGVIRRRPDIKWHRRPAQITALARQQEHLLDRAAALLKPGGTLVYSTCTVAPRENQDVVRRFLAQHHEFELDDLTVDPITHRFAPDGSAALPPAFIQTLPHRHGTDGFFIARMRRKHP